MSDHEIHQHYQRGYEDGKLANNGNSADDFKNLRTRFECLQASVNAFEKASGVRIPDYGGEYLGEAMRMVLNKEHLRQREGLDNLKHAALHIADYIERILKGVNDVNKQHSVFPQKEPVD